MKEAFKLGENKCELMSAIILSKSVSFFLGAASIKSLLFNKSTFIMVESNWLQIIPCMLECVHNFNDSLKLDKMCARACAGSCKTGCLEKLVMAINSSQSFP